MIDFTLEPLLLENEQINIHILEVLKVLLSIPVPWHLDSYPYPSLVSFEYTRSMERFLGKALTANLTVNNSLKGAKKKGSFYKSLRTKFFLWLN